MIPRIIHQIWLGDEPLPHGAADWRATWRQQHPDWDHHLWRSPPFTLVNQHEFDTAKHQAQKADILRYELLFHFGGVYADVDVECLKSFEPLLAAPAFAGYERPEEYYLCNAVIGAEPGSLFMRHLHPKTGRWITRDPVDYEDGTSIYAYVHNNGCNSVDLYGFWELRCRRLAGAGYMTFQRHCWVECGGHSYSLLNKGGTATPVIDDPADKGLEPIDN